MSVAAVLFHCSEDIDITIRHRFCPRSSESWCKYQKDQLNGESTNKERISIPSAIVKVLKTIFSYTDLGNDELLKWCLHSEKQNPNELFHNMIWKWSVQKEYLLQGLFLKLLLFQNSFPLMMVSKD